MELIRLQNPFTAVCRILLLSTLCLVFTSVCFAQFNVTEIITDYSGYWKSAATSINVLKPDNSHNLVSFSFNDKRYSTGVNDALLTSKEQSFIPGSYKALPLNSVGSAVTSNTKIGLGYLYDGVTNGPSNSPPTNNIAYYLSDGINGLNLGTCVANLPAGTLNFAVGGLVTSTIGDGIPDIVITQIADPSGTKDRYEFTDINGTVVGNYVDITLTNIPPVGNWTADFYEASTNPMTLAGGFTKTDRPIRLWATDLSSFGINSSNASRVAYFRIILSGNSDVAFVAYNTRAINMIDYLLPVELSNFSAKTANNQVQLSWQTSTETNSDVFIAEKSTDGSSFTSIGNVKAVGNSIADTYYSYTDKNVAGGKNYYRLKIVDMDGHTQYSKIISVSQQESTNAVINLYPNPARNYIIVNHPAAGINDQFNIYNLQGNLLLQKKVVAGSFQTQIEMGGFAKGTYQVVWTNGSAISTNSVVIL